ncbi:MAG: SIMPL domain-containing protein [Alistipes sp.]|nr:SIMPL domain-containing protein [Alistipes sp.]
MKKIVLMTAVLLAAIGTAAAQETERKPYIQVSGRAEKELVPDMFYLMITIDEQDSKGKISVETQQREMIKVLRQAGVDTDKALTMANVSSSYYKKQTSLASARYQLCLDSPAMLAKVLAALSDMGISNAALQRVTHSKMDQYRNQVRIEAIQNARQVAQTLAEAIDQKCGKCMYIIDYNRNISAVYDNAVMTRSAKFAAGGIMEEDFEEEAPEFKTIKIEYDVQACFELL